MFFAIQRFGRRAGHNVAGQEGELWPGRNVVDDE
mgnify:CR=1 FL=1